MKLDRITKKNSFLSMNYTEFFNCNPQFNNKSQLKGIFYDQKYFYIFIKHHYLKIGDDLISQKFRILEEYFSDSKWLKFETDDILKSLVFEEFLTKWTKVLANQTYFSPFDEYFSFDETAGKLIYFFFQMINNYFLIHF